MTKSDLKTLIETCISELIQEGTDNQSMSSNLKVIPLDQFVAQSMDEKREPREDEDSDYDWKTGKRPDDDGSEDVRIDRESDEETKKFSEGSKKEHLYVIQGRYEGGWEDVDQSLSKKEALVNLKKYRENEKGILFRLVNKWEYPDKINEAEKDMLGAKTRVVPPEEMQSYLGRNAARSENPKLTKSPEDKYKMPFIHASNVEIKDANDRTFDLDKLRMAITQRPKSMLQQNDKITHSGGDSTVYFNIGLPALKGLAVNEKTNEFVVVDTCPGAGACKVYCYARKGGYIQFAPSSMNQTRMLNFLLNDPDGFKTRLEGELTAQVSKFAGKKAKLVVRWHDAGDFFSPDYLNLAYSVAKDFPDVEFYAYTKMASVAQGDKPSNFKMNFSGGATPDQEKKIDFTKTKHSSVVPKDLFVDLIIKDENGKAIRDAKKKIQFKPEDLKVLKERMAKKYNLNPDTIVTYDEMMALPVDNNRLLNVAVRPGDGDDAANRSDVLGTYLFIH